MRNAPVDLLKNELLHPRGGDLMVTDLTCGASLAEEQAKVIYYYDGRTYSFCSSQCRDEFLRDVLDSAGCGGE